MRCFMLILFALTITACGGGSTSGVTAPDVSEVGQIDYSYLEGTYSLQSFSVTSDAGNYNQTAFDSFDGTMTMTFINKSEGTYTQGLTVVVDGVVTSYNDFGTIVVNGDGTITSTDADGESGTASFTYSGGTLTTTLSSTNSELGSFTETDVWVKTAAPSNNG